MWEEGVPGEPIYTLTEKDYEVGPMEVVSNSEPVAKALLKILPRTGSCVNIIKPDKVMELENEKEEANKNPNEWVVVQIAPTNP